MMQVCLDLIVLNIIGKFMKKNLKDWHFHLNKNKRLGSALFIQHFIESDRKDMYNVTED